MKLAIILLCILTSAAVAQEPKMLETLKTQSGINFVVSGGKPIAPAPVIFVFGTTGRESLEADSYGKVGRLLTGKGFISVSLDLPCHGEDAIPGEPNALAGWRQRIESGDNIVREFVSKASSVLDCLIEKGYADPARIAACGTSRGGFLATHFAAADSRVRCCAAFSPVTDLLGLSEFAGMEEDALTKSLALEQNVGKLTDKAIWICIGNDDRRVGTDRAISFSRKLVKACSERGAQAKVDLHVVNGQPHRLGHLAHAGAHDDAAIWIAARIGEK